jgi:hypothetical protein
VSRSRISAYMLMLLPLTLTAPSTAVAALHAQSVSASGQTRVAAVDSAMLV